ncbi:MAG: hypothetical protein ACYDAR_15805 [Thermomicrobiales bacterium]
MGNHTNHRQETPNTETHATFAGDATGAVGGSAAASVAPDTLPHGPQSPNAHIHDPGKPSHEVEDAGWVKEGQGSSLAQEREGVPEGEIPHNLPESAAQPRRKA